MKRHAWLTLGLGLGLSLAVAACSDEAAPTSDNVGDGGLSDDQLSEELKRLRDELAQLNAAQGTLDGRLTMLEAPEIPGSCSAGELCIPDGVDLSKQGLDPIIQALCKREETCCTPGELNYFYGPAITNAADCALAFKDIVDNGLSYSNATFSEHLREVVRVAHALNDLDVRAKINSAGVDACAASIQADACPGGEADLPVGCRPETTVDDPCSLESLLTGLEVAGDACDPESGVPECGEGLICRGDFGSSGSQSGICTPKPTADDRCTRDSDCGELFCNFASGLCQVRAKLGEACEYVDPSFVTVKPQSSYRLVPFGGGSAYKTVLFGNGGTTKTDCELGLSCDPIAHKCARSWCDAGAFCFLNEDCPKDTVCRRLQDAAMVELAKVHPRAGVCGAALAQGASCQAGNTATDNECASNVCSNVVSGVGTCAAPRAADGGACTTPADCLNNYCGTDGTCAAVCDLEANPCEGAECRTCATGSFCSNFNGVTGRCKPLIADTFACDFSQGTTATYHASCASGYCNGTSCQSKAAIQPIGSICNAGADCGYGATCWDTDGPLTATEKRCYENGKFPAATYCTQDLQCESEWCRSNGTTTQCTPRLADGAACDAPDANSARCGLDSYCAAATGNSGPGTCKPQGLTGTACQARFDGRDCRGGSCSFINETFMCDLGSLPEDRISCHAGF